MAFNLSDLHVNRPLTNMVLKFDPSKMGLQYNRIWPKMGTDKLSNQIRAIAREQMLRAYNLKTSAAGRVARVQFATGATQTYNCEVFSAEALLDAIEQENADSELQYQIQQQQQPIISMQVYLEKLGIEQRLRDTSVFTNTVALNANQQWNNGSSSSSNPFIDLLTGVKTVASQAQAKANVLMMDHLCWGELIVHPAITKLVNFWSNGSIINAEILEKMLGDWLEPGSIIIYRARYNAAVEGVSEAWQSYMGPDVFIGYQDQPGMQTWGYGQRFQWNMLSGDDPAIVFEFPTFDAPMGGRVVRTVTAVDFKATNAAKTGYLITAAVDKTLTRFNGELG